MASFFSSPNVSKSFGSTSTSTNTGAAGTPFGAANTTGNSNTSSSSAAPPAVAWTIPFGNSSSSTTPQQATSTNMTNNTNSFATSTQPTTSTSAALPSGNNTTTTTGAAPAPFSFASTSSLLTSGNNNTNVSAPNAFGNVQNTFGSTPGVATTATGTTNMFGNNNTTGGGNFGSGFGFGANVVSNSNNSTQQPQFGFQQPQNASLNAAAAAGGVAMNTPFGINNTNTLYSNSNNNNMICNWQDYNKQSALASYLFEFDKAYDAFHSSCHFRGFVYNKCNPGQAQAAIQKDRYIAHIHGCFDLSSNNNNNMNNNIYSNGNSGGNNEGTGATVEQYMCAINANPDKNNTYPAPVHFMQELEHRTDKQKEAIKSCHEQVANIHSHIQHLQEIQDRNDTKATAIRKRQQALQTRWLRIVRQVELLRKWHQPFNPQEMLMNKRVGEMHSLLFDAGGVNETLNELQLYLQKEATQLLQSSKAQSTQGVSSSEESTTPIISSTQQRSVTNTPNPSTTNVNYSKRDTSNNIMMKLSVPLLYSDIHPELMRAWLQLTESVQHTIESLYSLLQHDLNEMTAIRKRVMLEQESENAKRL